MIGKQSAILIVLIFAIAGVFGLLLIIDESVDETTDLTFISTSTADLSVANKIDQPTIVNIATTSEDKSASEELPVIDNLLNSNVPFSSQSPLAEWSDPRQQDGCEEMSAIMAMHWVQGEPLTKASARKELLDISSYQEKNYGSFRDTSAYDTVARIFNGYYQYQNASIKNKISQDDIVAELAAGRLVIAPMDGQALDNPNYTGNGPERHMLVLIGFDRKNNQFITNDPGTRKGAGYRYDMDKFMAAIRDYPTGDHEALVPMPTAIIIVSK